MPLKTAPFDTVNATNRPLCDHAGLKCPPSGAPSAVIDRMLVPSLLTTLIVDWPGEAPSKDAYAMTRPSGDQAGDVPVGATCRGEPPVAGITQMPPCFIE